MSLRETRVLTRTVNKEAHPLGGACSPDEKYWNAQWQMVMGFYIHDAIAKNLTGGTVELNPNLTRHLNSQFLRQYLNLSYDPDSQSGVTNEPGVVEGSLFLDGVDNLKRQLDGIGSQVASQLREHLPQGDYQHFYFPELAFTFNLGQKEAIDEGLNDPGLLSIAQSSGFSSVEDLVRSFLVDRNFTFSFDRQTFTAQDMLNPDSLPSGLNRLHDLLVSMACFYQLTLTPDQQSRLSLDTKHLLLELTSRSDIVVFSAKPGSPAALRLSRLEKILNGAPGNRFFGNQPLFDLNRPPQDLADLRDIVNGILFAPDEDGDNRIVLTLLENKTQTLTAAQKDGQLHRVNFIEDRATPEQLRGFSHTLLSFFELAMALNRYEPASPDHAFLPDFMNLPQLLSKVSNPDHRRAMLRCYYSEIKKLVDRQNLIFCKVFWPINPPPQRQTDETGLRVFQNDPPDAVLIDRLNPQVALFPLDSKVAASIPQMLTDRLESELNRFFPSTSVLPQEPQYIPV